ncbi:MAG: septum formation inhibitor Maf [Deltaproteobacteria bacterium]|nr:septum formation inhibitor Maf [Deltaproteobacteria bacterium]MBW2667132.1 septum formation inhibitor Maf [Deltaproteobacteria bacterium]
MDDQPLILASASPRRRDLLDGAGIAFEVIPADIAEERRLGERPVAFASRLAAEKARAVADRVGPEPARRILGADTIVVLDDSILGKPRDPRHAREMLARLTGRSHQVITAIALIRSDTLEIEVRAITSRVSMRAARAEELRDYVATGESLDKAGAYALQGGGRRFVERVEGSESNVIGLPLDETLELLGAPDRGTRGR